MTGKLDMILQDITTIAVDAIVNAANPALAPGGGVCGAIYAAAGPGLWEECKRLGGCPPGQARLTGGFQLPARYIIHTVAPVWCGGCAGEREILASCYHSCLELAKNNGVRTIAFPSLGTGIYGVPIRVGAETALQAVLGDINADVFDRIVLCCYCEQDLDQYKQEYRRQLGM